MAHRLGRMKMENLNSILDDDGQPSGAQLRKILNMMFPQSYIKLYHLPPHSVCSLFEIRFSRLNTGPIGHPKQQATPNVFEASSEPSPRARIAQLREQFNLSLIEHQAKPVGLCPIRRAIYDQCFDELIRQVTVGCIEQGLLLFKIRNELRMTLNYFKKIYESGVRFGVNKAIEAELWMEENKIKISQLESRRQHDDLETDSPHFTSKTNVKLLNELDSSRRIEEYYRNELEKKEQIIIQQRSIIQALTNKFTDAVKSPI